MVELEGKCLLVDLISLEINDFDVILGMDYLVAHHATVDCRQKKVTFTLPGQLEPFFQGKKRFPRTSIISTLYANKLLKKGCMGYVASVADMQKSAPSIEDLSIVRDFCDVFPEDLPGLPLYREIEFTIDLTPSTAPISKAPYKIGVAELRELQTQLQE
ncbi:uncharacterized protein [Typha latifolia]|uniref:uncharacterized protein n=1 Tax=Typha latifolia TaxID=4733 RepID=UPI003C30E4E7